MPKIESKNNRVCKNLCIQSMWDERHQILLKRWTESIKVLWILVNPRQTCHLRTVVIHKQVLSHFFDQSTYCRDTIRDHARGIFLSGQEENAHPIGFFFGWDLRS